MTTTPDRADDEVVERWDAGEMGCGELVVQLRRHLATLAPGARKGGSMPLPARR